jgi:hypothetical protein
MAETNNIQTPTQGEGGIDYEKIEAMITKGTQQKESAILKSYFEQQGLSNEEMTQAINDFKANRKNAAQQRETEFTTLKTENAQLKEQMLKTNISNEAQRAALELGVDAKNVQFVLKLADFDGAVSDKGEINAEAVKSAVSKVLEEVPAFKQAKNDSKGFIPVGGKEQTADDEKAAEERLRKAFGL